MYGLRTKEDLYIRVEIHVISTQVEMSVLETL